MNETQTCPTQVNYGRAIWETNTHLFLLQVKPTNADRDLIEGKFKSVHNASPNTAKLMANTFYALLGLADLSATIEQQKILPPELPPHPPEKIVAEGQSRVKHTLTFHYNIQIHLPATKDVEVFNAIFKALKEHLLE